MKTRVRTTKAVQFLSRRQEEILIEKQHEKRLPESLTTKLYKN